MGDEELSAEQRAELLDHGPYYLGLAGEVARLRRVAEAARRVDESGVGSTNSPCVHVDHSLLSALRHELRDLDEA